MATTGTQCCPCCFVYQQRQEIRDITKELYACCGGICQFCDLGEPVTKDKHQCGCVSKCVAAQVLQFLATVTWYRPGFARGNDACDVCIIRHQGCLQCLAEILTITDAVDDATAEAVDTIADLITCCVMSCMLAQQQAFKR